MTQISAEKGGLAVAELPVPETMVSPRDLAMDRLKLLQPTNGTPDGRGDLTPSALALIRADFPIVIACLSKKDLRSCLAEFPIAKSRVMTFLGQDDEEKPLSPEAPEVILGMLMHDGNLHHASLGDDRLVGESHGLFISLAGEVRQELGISYEEGEFTRIGENLLVAMLTLQAVSPIEGNTGDADYKQHCKKVAICRRLSQIRSGYPKMQEQLTNMILEEKRYLNDHYLDRGSEYKSLFDPEPKPLVLAGSRGWVDGMTPAELHGLGSGDAIGSPRERRDRF